MSSIPSRVARSEYTRHLLLVAAVSIGYESLFIHHWLNVVDEGFTLYDHNADAYVDLYLDGDEFEGFDYATGTRYTGEVHAEGIRIFDYGEYTDFEYSLKQPN